jgi:glutathione S-transferase
MSDLTLYVGSTWDSPWAFHALVALEEQQLPYRLEVVPMPIPADTRSELRAKAIFGKVPILVHGDVWLSESLAISEYLAERFPPPQHPALMPGDLVERARARQVMSFVRTTSRALREDRPTSSVFGRPTTRPLSEQAKTEAEELVRVASAFVAPGKTSICSQWSIADADLALMLMRLVANSDPMPSHLIEYTLAVWDRRSVRRYIAHLPTTH